MGSIIPKMGIKSLGEQVHPRVLPRSIGLSDALFSGVQQRVLGLLFGQPDKSFHANEISKLTHSGRGALQRELRRLTDPGLVFVTPVGNQKRYQANPNSPIFTELCEIVRKTFGLADVLREALMPLAPRIRQAFVYGSVAKNADTSDSDIDLLVVSDTVSYQEVLSALVGCESRLGRKVNPNLYSVADIERRLAEGNSFISRVLQQPKLMLIGDPNDFGATRKSGEGEGPESGGAGTG